MLLRRTGSDRALFWMVLLLALHFFPRTVLTAHMSAVGSTDTVLGLSFWEWVLASIALLGVGAGLGLLLILGNDILNGLRKERDSDPMTGLLNRRDWKLTSMPCCYRRGAVPIEPA